MTTTGSGAASWTFSLRTRYPDSDSDSDAACEPDADPNTVPKADTSDTRLMREMDLSGRHETVEYRPNPWSIARINAVTRSSLPKPIPTARPSGSSKPPPKSQPKPIVEAFKKQVQRDPRVDRQTPPVMDKYVSSGDPRTDKLMRATTTEKSHQGSVCDRALALAQPRVGPGRAPMVNPHSTHQNLQTNSTVRVGETLKKGKLAHISSCSNVLIEPACLATPVEPRRAYAIHRGTHSSPLRCAAPRSPSDIGNRLGPTFRHSSPRSPLPVSGSAHAVPQIRPVSRAPCTTSVASNARCSVPLSPPFYVNEHQQTESNWPLDTRSEAADLFLPSAPPFPLVPDARPYAMNPPHIRTPDPPRRRLASPDPTRAPKKPRVSVGRPLTQIPTSQRCPSAYAFGEDDDPDAEWSTLARTKRSTKRAPKPGKMEQSGPFRLPIPGLAHTTLVQVPQAKRRVITYMPPPMAGKKLVDGVDDGSRATATDLKSGSPTRGRTNDTEIDLDEQDEDNIETRIMDSDVTLVNEDLNADVVKVVVDVDDIHKRYSTTRASMKAASRLQRAVPFIVEVRL